jgi:uncharacterized protein
MLRIAKNLAIPTDAVTETFAFLAKRGAGKTYTAKVFVEELLKNQLQTVVIDPMGAWWGLRSSADGKGPGFPIAIVGGEHGDLPLEPTAGELIADLIVDEGVSAIIDVSLFSKGKRKEFVVAFAERLYHRNRAALHLVLEEADLFAPQRPQRGEERMLGAIEDLVRRGRGRGIGISLITQRSAVVNKDVLTQTECLVALRTTSPHDRKAIEAWIDVHGDKAERDVIMDSLPSLPIGEAWFWSPGFMQELKRIKIRTAETFDSSATPKAGQTKRVPKTVADIDLPAVKERMAETIERAKATDPKELRKKVAALEKELRTRPTEKQVERVEVPVEVPVLSDDVSERLEKAVVGLRDIASEIMDGLKLLPAKRLPERPAPRVQARPVQRPVAPKSIPTDDDGAPLATAQQKILDALAWMEAMGFNVANRIQAAFLAGYSPSAGHFNNMVGGLRTRGLVAYPGDGLVALTEEGRAYAELPSRPTTVEELQSAVLSKLQTAQRKILSVLLDEYPNELSRADLAERSGYSVEAGHFNNMVGSLRSLGLVSYPEKGFVVAVPLLFLEGSS